MNALGNQIITQDEYAILGVRAGQAGIDERQLATLLAVIERETFEAAKAAARQVAMSVLPDLFQSMQTVHYNTASAIRDALSARSAGLGGMITHRRCVEIADAILAAPPQPRVVERQQ